MTEKYKLGLTEMQIRRAVKRAVALFGNGTYDLSATVDTVMQVFEKAGGYFPEGRDEECR